MTIGENIKRLRIQIGLTHAEFGQRTKISEFLIKRYELNIFKPRFRHLKSIALALGIDSHILLDSDFNNTMAMHRIFQIFRQYDGYFDSNGNLKFKKLPLSDWKHQWEIYQRELMQAKTIKNKLERDYAVEDAEDKFNYWMDIYPKSNCYNIDFDKSWNLYRKNKNSKRNYKNILVKNNNANICHNIPEELMHWNLRHNAFKNSLTIELHNNKHLLGFIQYSVVNSCLHIENIYTTSYGQECSFKYSNIHVGTYIFNNLLLHLNEKKLDIKKITGTLSSVDAYNRNWQKAIPFYTDFNLHLHKGLPYQLEFHLFSNLNYKNEVELPANQSNREIFIEKFIEEHIKSNSGASFQYDIIPH